MPVFYDTEADAGGAAQRGRDQWPALRTRGSAHFTDLARRMFARIEARGADPVLCVYLHPWEFVSMPVSVHTDESTITFAPFLYEHTGTDALNALSDFLGTMREDGVRFVPLRTLGEEARRDPQDAVR